MNMIPLILSTSRGIVNNNSGAEKAFIILSVHKIAKTHMEVINFGLLC